MSRLYAMAALLVVMAIPAPVGAQQESSPAAPCGFGLVHQKVPRLLHHAATEAGHVTLSFVGHSTFVIETAAGIRAVTDFNDLVKPAILPDLVTMNTGHATHSTPNVPPDIKHVLRGWDPSGSGIARHNVQIKDLRVFNLPTNLGDRGAGWYNDSSIFVFETAGLCIAHMGNLRHAVDRERAMRMGRVDVLLAPVDRFITNTFDELVHNIELLQPRLVIPMHLNYIQVALDFAAEVADRYPSKVNGSRTITLSRASLPETTQILVLPLRGPGIGEPL